MKHNCPQMYRKPGKPTAHCKLLTDAYALCGHQYKCPQTGMYELTAQAVDCPLRKKNQEQ